MTPYLASSASIDWKTPAVHALARQLAVEAGSGDEAIARRCFEFVRDEIRHSWDYRSGPVTLRASEVLAHRTGYCCAKSHLLAEGSALTRHSTIEQVFENLPDIEAPLRTTGAAT